MRLVFCFARKTRRGPVGDLVEDYLQRLRRYTPVEVVEAVRLERRKGQGVHVVLDERGDLMTSEGLARFLERNMNEAARAAFFYTGGPDGLAPGLLEGADLALSLSRMTFNHQLVRVMLLEQVYRAMTIIRKEPYHRP